MLTLEPVAHIHSDFPTKFGIPRQSGLVEELEALVVFEPPWRDDNALRGIEGFSHLWADLGIFPESAGKLVAHGAAPAPGRQPAGGRVCLPLALPAQSLGLSCVRLLGLEKLPGQGTALPGGRRGPHGRHAHL